MVDRRRHSLGRVWFGPVVGVLMLIAACGQQAGTGPVSAQQRNSLQPVAPSPSISLQQLVEQKRSAKPSWTPSPPAPGEYVYPELGVRTLPAPAGTVPDVSLNQVLQNIDVIDFAARGLAPGTPDAELRLFTGGDFGPDTSDSTPQLTRQLAWFLTYHGSPADYRGPPGFMPPSPLPLCSFYIAIDAISGTTLLTAQDCGKPLTSPS